MADKPVVKPPPPDCWYGSVAETTGHTFVVFVQGEPALIITYCTRCGQLAQDRKP